MNHTVGVRGQAVRKSTRLILGASLVFVLASTFCSLAWDYQAWVRTIDDSQRAAVTAYMNADDAHREIYQQLMDCKSGTGSFQGKAITLVSDCKQIVRDGINHAADPTGVQQAFENYDRALNVGADVPSPNWAISALLALGKEMSAR